MTHHDKETKMFYTLEQLPYSYDSLEPYFDKQTMEIHHSKHHQAYINNLNAAIKDTNMEQISLVDLLKDISKYPVSVRNNGGGHFNHDLFWKTLKPNNGKRPGGKLHEDIVLTFGSFEQFKQIFGDAAKGRFGSGWAWLSVDESEKLFISSTPNQDNPLMDVVDKKGTPILGLDVWEHAYYLKFQNRRPDYIDTFWQVVNWDEVAKRYEGLKQ